MSVTAIVCELNPLHNGHMHVMKAAKGDAVVLVMSGNFTQRALSAAFHKYARAEAAVRSGADLVVELPFPYCSSGGEFFARAGVSIAERIGADRLMFGSSCADRELLSDIARILSSEEYRRLFSETEKCDPALGAAVIRSKVLGTLCPGYSREKCDNPNDILAAEYIRSAKIECVPVKRTDDALSATELRGMTAEEGAPFVPPASLEMMMNTPRADVSKLREILWMFFRMCGTDFENIAECRGGLGNRLRSAARQSGSAEEFFSLAATKKYTNARIVRAAIFALIGVTPEDISSEAAYTNVLAANGRGSEFLAAARRSGKINVVTKPSSGLTSASERRQRELSSRADEFYTLLFEKALPSSYFITRTPYVI